MPMADKRRLGDRKDGRLLRDLDAMHYIVPIIYPNRCDNEAFISERIDLTRERTQKIPNINTTIFS